jgi:hypothetical protein
MARIRSLDVRMGCAQLRAAKRTSLDGSIFNRAKAKRRYWGNSVAEVLERRDRYGEYEYRGYQSKRYQEGASPPGLNDPECQQLKDCITAAIGSSASQSHNFTSFNQDRGRGRVKICRHYFRRN